MHLKPIPSIEGITKREFQKLYIDTKTPVVIKDFVKDSPALEKWNFPYLKSIAGHLEVSLHGNENAHTDKVNSLPVAKMQFGDYLDLIESTPTEYRLFLFDLLMEKPFLKKDVHLNPIAPNLISWLPFMFFGGAGSSVRYHYDIDMSHVFLVQFQGIKKVQLFDHSQSNLLYRLPFNFHGIADLRNPDYGKFPALQYLDGWECSLEFGDTLFIPSGYWHYIQYLTGGYSVSYRALSSSTMDRIIGLRNILLTRRFDNTLRKIFHERWYQYKIRTARRRASAALKELS